jgi:ATP-dependent DNA ligase
VPRPKVKAEFIEPTLIVRSDTLPEGPNWAYELKLDGYRGARHQIVRRSRQIRRRHASARARTKKIAGAAGADGLLVPRKAINRQPDS